MVVTVKGCVMAHPHHCLVTQKLQSTYFNVLYAYFIIGRKIRIIRAFYYWTNTSVTARSHYAADYSIGQNKQKRLQFSKEL